ncbi:hypothetical protein [Streptomyces sp. NRRL F-5193]|uniref:hypothetical protein n=1 Tax=Streptomyces sp. NRRL F-5193 TaxID=1463860 RepID=UPI00131BE420|nr:hypothetical protein [Streptomyces sp. NRRL F-5193]
MRTSRSRRRLVTAVAVAFAVTAGAAAAPALAAPASAPALAVAAPAAAGEAEQDAIGIRASLLRGSGPSGFLTRSKTTADQFFWTRYADGATVTLPRGEYHGSARSDVIVRRAETDRYAVYDMSTGGAPVEIDTAFLGSSAQFLGPSGKTLVFRTSDASGNATLHLVSQEQGAEPVDRTVTGLPADTRVVRHSLSSPGVLALLHTGSVDGVSKTRLGVVDLTSGKLADSRVVPAGTGSISASDTHVAWVDGAYVVTARRGATTTVRTSVGWGTGLRVDLMGDWVTYSLPGGSTATTPSDLHALTARSLTAGNATTVKILDTTLTAYAEAGGGLLVQGGTVAQGEGVYRIAPGADGRPVATLVADTGESTALAVTDEKLPGTIDLRRDNGEPHLSWGLNQQKAQVTLKITETATGAHGWVPVKDDDGDGTYTVFWNGELDGAGATNGAYTWTMTAQPANRIGPDLIRSGSFTLDSGHGPHAYSNSFSPDLLTRTGSGRLVSYDVRRLTDNGHSAPAKDHGGGWQIYDRVIATGNVAGTTHADVLGRDRAGVLWFYQGTDTGLARRTQVGGGWQVYDKLAGGTDVTGDGRADLLAADRSGVLWLYPATGDTARPFATRKKIGGGWQVYDKLVSLNNVGGDGASRLFARDKNGVLWDYWSPGDGTFKPRRQIGGGWQRYKEIVGTGNADSDDRFDLIGHDPSHLGRTLHFYGSANASPTMFLGGRKQLSTPPALDDRNTLVF